MSQPQTPFKVKAIFDYNSDHEEDLSFKTGQIITVQVIEDEDWYNGSYDGQSGMFPKNFVQLIPKREVPQPPSHPPTDKVLEPESKKEPVPEPEPEPQSKSVPQPDTESEAPQPEAKPPVESHHQHESPSSVKTGNPIFPHQKRDDPYAINKGFIASAKSSYIPQIKPRDDSFLIGGGHHHEPTPVDVVKATDVNAHDDNHDDEPEEAKLSLHERIALLQKRQQEEAEREQAALQRQQLRKKKAAEERERLKKQREEAAIANQATNDDSGIHDNESVEPQSPLEMSNTGKSLEAIHTGSSRRSLDASHTGSSKKSLDTTNTGNSYISGNNQPQIPMEEDEPIEEEPVNQHGDDDEEEEGEDDEDLRRRKLVERMAKISGGRNMFGMVGMSPFGVPSPSSKPASKSKEVEPEPEEEETEKFEEEDEVSTPGTAVPIPIMPFADPNALANLKRKSQPEPGSTLEVESGNKELEVDKNFEDEPSMGEDDQPNSGVAKSLDGRHHSLLKSNLEPELQTDSGLEDNKNNELPIKSDKTNKLENETTGYDADEDNSDRKFESSPEPIKATSTANSHPISAPPPPESVIPRAPQVPQVPHVPPIPVVPSVPAPPKLSTRAPPPAPPAPVVDDEEDIEEEDSSEDYDDANATKVIEEVEEQHDDDDDDEFEFGAPQRSHTLPPHMPPPIPSSAPMPPVPSGVPQVPTSSVPQPPSSVPQPPSSLPQSVPQPPPPATSGINRSVTDSGLARSHTGSSIGSIKRSSTDLSKTQAEQHFVVLHNEINDISNSNWWLKDLLPEFLTSKIGSELIYEVDNNQLIKRGNRTKIYKDYYILFYDLSQITIEMEYELQDPRSTIKVINFEIKNVPIIRKDLLDKYYTTFNGEILRLINNSLSQQHIEGNSLIDLIFSKLIKTSKILPPIGNKSFGVNIYKNVNNHNISKLGEIKSGDILCIKNGKFQVHKGLGSKTLIIGDEEIYSSVIAEFDSKKEKFKVFELVGGQIKQTSYKLSEMKSGQIRVFRVVGKDYVDW